MLYPTDRIKLMKVPWGIRSLCIVHTDVTQRNETHVSLLMKSTNN